MRKDPKKFGNHEIRFNKDGTVDEIVIRDEHGTCLFHLEQLDDNCYWCGTYDPLKPMDCIHVKLSSSSPIRANMDPHEMMFV
tara:strand:- start:1766 stop:2011 length:246 start_codon:yes stop_codon:yes gene_type:complete